MATAKATKKPREDLSGVDFEFANGAALAVNVEDLPADTIKNLLLHGISQKVGDSYSGSSTPEEAFQMAAGVLKRLQSGEWRVAREGGGGKRTTMLTEALHRVFPDKTMEECTAKIADLSDEQVKGLKLQPKIKAALAAITAERAAAKAAKEAEAASDAPEVEDDFDF